MLFIAIIEINSYKDKKKTKKQSLYCTHHNELYQ